MLEDTKTLYPVCSWGNVCGFRMRRKIQNISLFSSITKYIPALHSRLHQTLADVNSALNWQFKRVTQTEYDTQNSVRSRCISYSLLYRNQKYILKIHIRASIFMHCPRGFSLWFYYKGIFHSSFCRLVKAISGVQLWMLIVQHEAVLGRAGVLQIPWKAQGWLAMRRWRFIIKTCQMGMHHHFRAHNMDLPS